MEESISRRSFIGGMGAALAAATAVATGCTPATEAEKPEAADAPAEEPATEKPQLASTASGDMTDAEALAALQDEAEITSDLTLDDGTVIPALYVRVRNHANRVGTGLGSEIDTSANYWCFVMRAFSEEEAALYVQMPLAKNFTATELSYISGEDEAYCGQVLEDLSKRGLLYRTRRGGTAFYRLIPQINGMWEYSINKWFIEPDEPDVAYLADNFMQLGGDWMPANMDGDTPPLFRTVPVSAEVVGDERIISPFDDYEAILRRNTVIARGDCVCRAANEAFGETCDHPKQTEILTGEEAEYYIENGIGWPITADEAIQVIKDAIDEGLVIQTTFSKASEIFCCCGGDCCKMLNGVKAVGGGEGMQYYSHYHLNYDVDSCISCGTCLTRCHLDAITMDEDNHPQTGPTCVRCGQCAVTCPAGARTLVLNEDYPELPDTLVDSDLHKALTRMKRGHIVDFVPQA